MIVRRTRVSCLHRKRAISTYTTPPALLFGPREIYDTARARDKVIKVDYDRILQLPLSLAGVDASDLFVISKILRRVPKLDEPETNRDRHLLARSLTKASSDLGNDEATLFWSEETLRSKSSTTEERQTAMQLLTTLGMTGNAKANLLIGNELYSLGKKKEAMRTYRLAGEQGNGDAFTKLGRILRHDGHHKQSVQAFELAADLGEPNAHFMLSTFAAADHAAAQKKSDTTLASATRTKQIAHLHKAAAGGVVEAQHNLGDLYRKDGNAPLAEEYLQAAAKRGFQPSQANLAALLLDQKRYDDARAWCLEAQRGGGEIGQHAAKMLAAIDAAADQHKDPSSCTIM